MFLAQSWLVFATLTAGQVAAQQSSVPITPQQNPPQGQPQPTKPLKPNELDPNRKLTDIPDPTKDPTKDPSTDITRDPSKNPDAVAGQKPGAEDQSGADASGGGVTTDAPDYTGPAILSRGFALGRPAIAINRPLRFFAGVNAVYDAGLAGAYVPNGPLPSVASWGLDFNWGANMTRYRRHAIVDFNYGGHYYEYFGNGNASGQDHSLGAGYTYEFSPKLSAGFRETAGLYSNTYSILNSTSISDISLAGSTIVVAPNTEAFDDKTYFSTTTGSLAYRISPRLSYSIGAAFFTVFRNSTFLANTQGYQANVDVSYRITQRQSVGLYYAHSGYSYTKIFGDASVDAAGITYAISLDKTTDLSFRGGAARYDSQSLGAVVPNPLVQQVLGIQSGIEKFYFVGYSPDFSAVLSRKLRSSTVGASFSEGITPGNGLVLTSRHQGESFFWNLPDFRKLGMQLGAGRDTLSGYADGIGSSGSFTSYYVRFSTSRPITSIISSFMNIDYRQLAFGGNTFHQNEYRISAGLRWSPGQGPIKFW
jgi:hypothetical protein